MFDDDMDGLSSFLLIYRVVGEGKGTAVKERPIDSESYLRKIKDYSPDLVVLLDLAVLPGEFLNGISTETVWIDHHYLPEIKNKLVKHYNPHEFDENDGRPTTYWTYKIVKLIDEERAEKDLWIATMGCCADWFIPEFLDKFSKKWPTLLSPEKAREIGHPAEVLYETELGRLIRIVWFNLKGNKGEVKKSIKVMTRIKDPLDIVEEKTPEGKFIHKRAKEIFRHYETIMEEAESRFKKDDDLLVCIYKNDKISLTSDISNELVYRYKDKLIVVGRDRNGEIKGSLRTSERNIEIEPVLGRVFERVNGRGGGHPHACGFRIYSRDKEEFLRVLREEYEKAKGSEN